MRRLIGIEGGGTKFICAYGSGPDDLHERTIIRTQTPSMTMQALVEYIRSIQKKVKIDAIGASVFGPLDLDPHSSTYGFITSTPKAGWTNVDFVGVLTQEFGLPIGFDTDVNAAAISEYRWGAAQNLSDFLYLTVGTGIGGGLISNHQLIHGAMHPEIGHILVPHDREKDPFSGICKFHHDCLEGLASGPSIRIRWKVKSALDLPENHPGWELEAHYLGIAMANFTLMFSPKRIIIGGGVMRQNHLLPKIRRQTLKQLNGYIQNQTVITGIDSYIVKPGLDENAGVCGAFALAELALAGIKKS